MTDFVFAKLETMSNWKSSTFEKALASLPGRILLVIFTMMVAAGALSLILLVNIGIPERVILIIILTILGLISGFSARILLRKYTRILQIAAALLSITAGMLILGIFTFGDVGFSITTSGIIPLNGIQSLQIIWGGLISVLPILAWNKSRRTILKGKKRSGKVKTKAIKYKNSTAATSPVLKQRVGGNKPRVKKSDPFSKIRRIPKTLIKDINKKFSSLDSWVSKKLTKRSSQIKLPRSTRVLKNSRNKFRYNSQSESITLVGAEQHNCPYCLDSISNKNSRDTKICTICKTWHHIDCWEAGGGCQVPHHH